LPLLLILLLVGLLFWSNEQVTSEGPITTHQMASGVAKFYATFRKSFSQGDKKLDDHTIELPKPELSLTKQLERRASQVNPASAEWTGVKKRRSFKENDTIKTALQNFGKEENMEVMWDLKYDYIIKHHFQEVTNLKQLSEKIAKTVNNDYDGQVKSYFCPQERALVLTASNNKYVKDFCQLTTSKRRQALDKNRAKEYQLRQKLSSDS
jgi:hypothetical protein